MKTDTPLTFQQRREQAFFGRFVEGLSELSDAKWSQQRKPHEFPDFVLTHGARRIGVEVTELLVSDTLRSEESLRTDILSAAQQSYYEQASRPLLVWVSFVPRLRMTKSDAKAVGHKAGSLIADKANTGTVSHLEREHLPAEVTSIVIVPLKDGAKPAWGVPEAGAIPELNHAALDAAIQKKNRRLEAYLEHCDEAWLIVAVEGYRPSTWFDVDGEALTTPYLSGFDRVYVLDFQSGRSHRLSQAHLPTGR